MKKINKLWSSVAILPLFLLGCKDSEVNIPHIADKASNNISMSDNAMKTYGKFSDVIDKTFQSDVRAILITPFDLQVKAVDYEHYDLLSYTMCDSEDQKLPLEIKNIIDDVRHRILSHIEEQGFSDLIEQLKVFEIADSRNYEDVMTAVAIAVLTETAATVNMTALSEHITSQISIISFPDDLHSLEDVSFALSGLSEDYVVEPSGTKEDWTLFILGHEFGHAHNLHGSEDTPDQWDKYCDTVDSRYLEQGVKDEGQADIEGSKTYVLGQKLGVASNADILKDVMAYRSIGTFHQNANFLYLESSEDVSIHMTNVVFSSEMSNFKDSLDLSNAPYSYEMPLHINTLADAVAGYLKIQNLREKLKENPDQFTKEEQEDIAAASYDFKDLLNIEDFNSLSLYGLDARFSGENEYFYAAITALIESEALAYMVEAQHDEYADVMLDIINDYLAAVETHGTDKLKNAELIEKAYVLSIQYKEELITLVDVFYNSLNHEEQVPNSDPKPEG